MYDEGPDFSIRNLLQPESLTLFLVFALLVGLLFGISFAFRGAVQIT